jgi:hypothetical protein
MAKVSKGFKAAKKVGGKVVAIKAKGRGRLAVIGKKIKSNPKAKEKWEQTYRRLLKAEHQANPTPDNMSRRDWQKLHKLPRPFKVQGGPAYRSLSRRWWDGFSRERQIEFRKLFPEPTLRKLFPLNSTRHRRK